MVLPLLTLSMTSKTRDSRGSGSFDSDWSHTWDARALPLVPLDKPQGLEAPTWTIAAPGFETIAIDPGDFTYSVKRSTDIEGQPLTVTMTKGIDLVVTVLDGDGSPITGAMVYLTHFELQFFNSGGVSGRRRTTDENGEAWWLGLPPGEVSVKARGPEGEISTTARGELDATNAGLVRLELTID